MNVTLRVTLRFRVPIHVTLRFGCCFAIANQECAVAYDAELDVSTTYANNHNTCAAAES
jgi:hypothetical protein